MLLQELKCSFSQDSWDTPFHMGSMLDGSREDGITVCGGAGRRKRWRWISYHPTTWEKHVATEDGLRLPPTTWRG